MTLLAVTPYPMLRCRTQIYFTSETSVNWALYLCGIKNVILDGLVHRKVTDQECAALKDWIYYHEVLARFSLVHWIAQPEIYPICYEGPKSRLIQVARDESLPVRNHMFGFTVVI